MATTAARKPGSARTNSLLDFVRPLTQNRLAYLYIFPAFLIMAFITFYPIGYQVWMAFTDFGLKHLRHQNPDFIWLQNFVNIVTGDLPLTNYNFLRLLVFNVLWTFVNVTFHVGIGVVMALLLNTEGLPGKRIYRSLFVIPWALPALISGMMWHNLWDQNYGAINVLLHQLIPTLGAGTPDWLGDINPVVNLPQIGIVLPLSFFAVLIANVWLGWPFMMVVATGALQSIPKELYEAANVDGASRWTQFWQVTLPLIRPAMVPAVMIGIMWTFNQFNIIYFVTGGGPVGLTEILVTQGFKLVNPQAWYGVAAAFNIIVFGILGVITLVTNRISRATEPYFA